jgi:hypothetical protein
MVKSETVYTFSFTVAWLHTVYAVAEMSTDTAAPPCRKTGRSVNVVRIRCTTRYQKNIVPAVMKAEKRLMRTAGDSPNGVRSTSHARASSTKSGLPGGWGMPRMCAVAMYSLVSQNQVVGPSVMPYSAKTAAAAARAARYGGRVAAGVCTGGPAETGVCAVGAAWLMDLGAVVADLWRYGKTHQSKGTAGNREQGAGDGNLPLMRRASSSGCGSMGRTRRRGDAERPRYGLQLTRRSAIY